MHSGLYLLSENGLYRVNASMEVLEHTHKGIIIRDMIETPFGIYMATYGNGFLQMKPGGATNRIFRDRFDWSNTGLSMRYDAANRRLWLVCNKGIFILDLDHRGLPKPAYSLLACGIELPVTELNGGNYVLLPGDKYYYFPSNDGLLKIPINWKLNKAPSELMLKSVSSDKGVLPVSEDIFLPAKHGNLTMKLLLPLSFHEENEAQEYRLMPLFEQWKPVPENRQIVFSQLPPGDYTLWVKNVLGERLLTNIHVAKFWYQEPVFYFSMLLLLFGIVAISIFLRTRTLRRRSMVLQIAVDKKTAALKQNLDALKQSQHLLKQETALRENMNSVLLHDIRSPLLFLTQAGYSLNNKLKERYPDALDSANVLAGTVKDLYFLSSDYIIWLKNRKFGSRAETETLNLYELIDEIYRFYLPICSSNFNSIDFTCTREDQEKSFCTDGQLLRCVLRNLIDNCNKFTRKGQINIELKHHKGFADITVYDNGSGLPARILTTFAKRSKENPNLWTLKAMPTEEIGMNMILQFAEILNGVITYERLPEGRSKFQLRLKELSCQSSDSTTSLKSMP
ncbi:MAG: HAMP domain-containing histidine kinase [Bacteroidetes bacterium]|nr:HAMP domain-containing histidine kinase [Bacteroidota bacterium]